MRTERPRLRLRDVALWIAIGSLGLALFGELAEVPVAERRVIESAQIAGRASEALFGYSILPVEYQVKEIERHARLAVESLQRDEERATKKVGR
jgi:hypothetical protein